MEETCSIRFHAHELPTIWNNSRLAEPLRLLFVDVQVKCRVRHRYVRRTKGRFNRYVHAAGYLDVVVAGSDPPANAHKTRGGTQLQEDYIHWLVCQYLINATYRLLQQSLKLIEVRAVSKMQISVDSIGGIR